eukprot:2591502-Amphidinium_carterae.1
MASVLRSAERLDDLQLRQLGLLSQNGYYGKERTFFMYANAHFGLVGKKRKINNLILDVL